MFEVIGYWGVLTATLIFPIILAAWVFTEHTNKRIQSMGGNPVKAFKAFDKALDIKSVGIPLILGCIVSFIISCAWVLHVKMLNKSADTFIGWHSDFAELLSPVSGFFIAFVVALVLYEMALKAYVRVNRLVSKLEAQADR